MAEKPKDNDCSTMRQAAAQGSTMLLRSKLIRRQGVMGVTWLCRKNGRVMQGADNGRPLVGERVRCGGKRRKIRKWQDVVIGSEQRRSLGVFPPTFYFLQDAVQKLLQVEVESSHCADAKGRHRKDVLGSKVESSKVERKGREARKTMWFREESWPVYDDSGPSTEQVCVGGRRVSVWVLGERGEVAGS